MKAKLFKPVIYLYPEKETVVSVKLNYDGELLCTYPEYNNGWFVTAYPDGKIINNNDGLEYSYLFWDGVDDYKFLTDTGFVVKGDETEAFLRAIYIYTINVEMKTATTSALFSCF